jgi:hypothetical protein
MDLVREEKFMPGLDQGLKAWLRMRQELRDARNSGYSGEMTLPRSRFRFSKYWEDKIPYKCKYEDQDWHEEDAKRKPWQDQDRDFLEALEGSHGHHTTITDDLAINAMSMRHERHLGWLIDFMWKEKESINQPFTINRRTLLHMAAARGDTHKIELLLMAGADPNARDKFLNTPLMISLKEPRKFHPLEVMNTLMDCGANIDLKNDHGHTALHLACLIGNIELMDVLLARGASVLVRDRKKKMPIEYALVYHSMHENHRGSRQEVREVFHKNQKRIGKHKIQRMWSRIMSRDFVTQLMHVVTPNCPKCKRKMNVCHDIRLDNYRHWLLLHGKVPQ